jgi:hypothetical protein
MLGIPRRLSLALLLEEVQLMFEPAKIWGLIQRVMLATWSSVVGRAEQGGADVTYITQDISIEPSRSHSNYHH